jgi:hypothetical protein
MQAVLAAVGWWVVPAILRKVHALKRLFEF